MIHKNQDLKGIRHADQEYRVSLFADVVVIFLSSPTKSLPALEDIIRDFHAATGLMLNTTKSELYPVHLDPTKATSIKEHFSYRWITKKWRYLGTVIPLDLNHLYKENFIALLESTKSTLSSFAKQQ